MLLEQEGNNDREIETEEKTSDEFDLKYRMNFIQIGFMTINSFSEIAENNSREVRPRTSGPTFMKLWWQTRKLAYIHRFIWVCDSMVTDKNDTLSEILRMNYLKNLVEGKPQQ